jgi:hypothetical protein
VGSNPAGGMGMSVVSVVCCQVEVCVRMINVQRSRTECGVSECDFEASIMRRPWPARGCCAVGEKIVPFFPFKTGVGFISSVNQQ